MTRSESARLSAFASVPVRPVRGRIAGLAATWWEAGPVQGRPLVLVHGGGADEARLSWGRLIGPLAAAGHRVLAVDLPGYGLTESLRITHSIEDLADFLIDFCLTTDLDRPALCGISMGGGTVLSAALRRRGLARAVVAVAPYGLLGASPHPRLFWLAARLPLHRAAFALVAASERIAHRSTARLFADPARIDADLVPQVREAAARQARRPAFAAFARGEMLRSGFRTDLAPRLHEIDVRATLIHGEGDPLIPAAASLRAARDAGLPCELLPGGHLLPRERPDETLDAIVRAIA